MSSFRDGLHITTMKYLPIVWSNLKRKWARTLFTLLSVLVAFLLFGILMTIRQAFTVGATLAGQNRLLTMSNVSLTQSLPLAYLNRIKAVDGVREVSYENWFGGYYQDPRRPVFSFAIDAATFVDLYPEYVIDPAQKQHWLKDRTGALIGAELARQYGWKVGDRIPLQSNIWRQDDGGNTWDLTVDAIYRTSEENSGSANQLYLHYQYFDEARSFSRDTVSIYILGIADPARAPQIAEAVDALFANSPHETKTSTEKAFAQSFAAQFGDIGAIVTSIVAAVFFSMLLVTVNTMAQSVRERIGELALFKALGFGRATIVVMVLAEALFITALGGLLGLGLAKLVTSGLSASLSQFLPGFHLPGDAVLIGIGLIVVLGLLSGVLPAVRSLRLDPAAALGKA